MVSRTPTGISVESPEFFIYDGANVALILNSSGGVIERELNGPAVDQVFASEAGSASTTLTAGTVDWYLADNQGTVRDVVQYASGGTDGASDAVVNHLVYDTSGQVTSQTNSALAPTVMYAGMRLDPDTGLYYDKARWYDAVDAVFASQDPLGFGGGQTNTEEYCGNSPTNYTDPSGLTKESAFYHDGDGLEGWRAYQWQRQYGRIAEFNPDGSKNRDFIYAVARLVNPSGGGTEVDRAVSDVVDHYMATAAGATPDFSWWGAMWKGLRIGVNAGLWNEEAKLQWVANKLGLWSNSRLAAAQRTAKWYWDQVYTSHDVGGTIANGAAGIGVAAITLAGALEAAAAAGITQLGGMTLGEIGNAVWVAAFGAGEASQTPAGQQVLNELNEVASDVQSVSGPVNPFAPGSPIQNEITYYTGHIQFLQTEVTQAELDLLEMEGKQGDPQMFELSQAIQDINADIADMAAYVNFLRSLL
jgi:RHS repeat-associated protein